MTIAISIKVNDGVVLATDSASTMIGSSSDGQKGVVNVYNNANKLFNLYKGLPIGAITWGIGSIGHSSIATLSRDFRKLISSENGDWKIDPATYTMEDVANKFKKFIYDDNYINAFNNWLEKPDLGFIIAGYSSKKSLAEEWKIQIKGGKCNGPILLRTEAQVGLTANGMPDCVSRLYFGSSMELPNVLRDSGLVDPMIQRVMQLSRQRMTAPLVVPPMAIQDVIDLAIFLVEATINFVKFSPGAPSVGGPIEVAAITKHEGFKWVQRKYYFDRNLNEGIKED